MSRKVKLTYILIVFAQGLHSIEEYLGELWNNFPPARYLCSIVSDDLETGFIVINISLFLFGVISWVFIIKKELNIAKLLIWIWVFIEFVNGIGHPVWTLIQKQYTPGVLTAPLLLYLAIVQLKQMIQKKNNE